MTAKNAPQVVATPTGVDALAGILDYEGPDSESLATVETKPTDPTMDPGDPKWNPVKYFDAQPKEIVILHKTESDLLGDPSGKKHLTTVVSINGYALDIEKGVPTSVPSDFAKHIEAIGAGYIAGKAVAARHNTY